MEPSSSSRQEDPHVPRPIPYGIRSYNNQPPPLPLQQQQQQQQSTSAPSVIVQNAAVLAGNGAVLAAMNNINPSGFHFHFIHFFSPSSSSSSFIYIFTNWDDGFASQSSSGNCRLIFFFSVLYLVVAVESIIERKKKTVDSKTSDISNFQLIVTSAASLILMSVYSLSSSPLSSQQYNV